MILICNTDKKKLLEKGKDYGSCVVGYYYSIQDNSSFRGTTMWRRTQDVEIATNVKLSLFGGKLEKRFSLKNFN